MKTFPSYPLGTLLRDNDPRHDGRVVEVKSETFDRVFYFLPIAGNNVSRKTTVNKSRIFNDGKVRHQGFNLIGATT